jgi:hypothetical protein
MWGIMWGALTILKVAVRSVTRHYVALIGELPGRSMLGQRSDLSRGPVFLVSDH